MFRREGWEEEQLMLQWLAQRGKKYAKFKPSYCCYTWVYLGILLAPAVRVPNPNRAIRSPASATELAAWPNKFSILTSHQHTEDGSYTSAPLLTRRARRRRR